MIIDYMYNKKTKVIGNTLMHITLNLDIAVSSIRDPKYSSWCLFLFPTPPALPLDTVTRGRANLLSTSLKWGDILFLYLHQWQMNYNKMVSCDNTYKKTKDNYPTSPGYIKKWRIPFCLKSSLIITQPCSTNIKIASNCSHNLSLFFWINLSDCYICKWHTPVN